MTIAKITESNIRPLDEVDKINEIIDATNEGVRSFANIYLSNTIQGVKYFGDNATSFYEWSNGNKSIYTLKYRDVAVGDKIYLITDTGTIKFASVWENIKVVQVDIENYLPVAIHTREVDNNVYSYVGMTTDFPIYSSVVLKDASQSYWGGVLPLNYLDKGLSELSTTGRKVLYSKPTISRIVVVSEAPQHSDTRPFSLADYLPDDGSDYLVQISCRVVTASTSGTFMNCNLTSSLQTNGVQFCVARTRVNSLVEATGCGWMLIGSDRKLYHNGSTSTNYKGTYDIQAMAYIRVGSNS